ncbi:2-oxoglutarate dehydrogenase E1 component, partial [Salinispira pacifica]
EPAVSTSTNGAAPVVRRIEREVGLPGEDAVAAATKQGMVNRLIWAYRDVGYIYANLNPLGNYETPEMYYLRYAIEEGNYERLNLEDFGLSEADLDQEFDCGPYLKPSRAPLREILRMLKETYCSTMAVEFAHIQTRPMRRWLLEKIETSEERRVWTADHKKRFQKDLIKAEEFEHFVQANFIGQKRFSLEGGEALIPGLHYLIMSAAKHGLQEIVIGMAHRGRLNMFTNALRKPARETFAKFEDNYKPHTYGGSGDVKYHLGHSFDFDDKQGHVIHISLVANPSHLEAVDPVVEGKARGIQRRRGDRNRKKVVPILIHGDAAFSAQGIVSENFNLSQLKGYKTGGTVHIIVNNQIGFTTASRDSRSTFYVTDIAKMMPVPIFHVNGDHPEAVVRAVDLALRFRQKFGYDAVVDIVCYRRLGHNEADEPSFTHPIMYSLIKDHPSAATLYGKEVAGDGSFTEDDQEAFRKKYRDVLQAELKMAREGYKPNLDDAFEQGEWKNYSRIYSFDPVDTTVKKETLVGIARKLVEVPDEFSLHPKLKRFVAEREKRIEEGTGFDWAFAESLSFGSLLLEGHPIRLSGEDSARGTFSQRHAVWWDVDSSVPKTHTPLRRLSDNQASFSVYDSPLSEFSVLGFDYGYSLAQPGVLVMWEAQFGDFVNGAQVIIDNFISAGESKWFRSSGLVMLLPHAFEGQGAEHSSAHLERFLQLSAEENWQVVFPTTPAQYYHLLRKQMKQKFRKPLIVMTPKSLLRHKQCVSSMDEMASGSFQFVIDDEKRYADAKTILLCSGKVYYDILQEREKRGDDSTAIVRIEQLYPFPDAAVKEIASRYRKAEVFKWVQEEPRNRGAWGYIRRHLTETFGVEDLYYAGRAASASPATGSHKEHLEQLAALLEEAFSPDHRANRKQRTDKG